MSISRHPQLKFGFSIAAAMALIIFGGVLYGKYTQRWAPAVDLVAATGKLASIPRAFGDWKQVEEIPISETVLEQLQCAGYVNRVYVNTKSGQKVNVAILVGPAGPIAVHSPEICYSGRDFRALKTRERIDIQSSPVSTDTFWTVDFAATNPLQESLRSYYAWSQGKCWVASASPRFEYAGDPMLFKIQLACFLPPGEVDPKSDACRDFLEEFLRLAWKNVSNC